MDPKTRCIIQTISVGKYPISLHAVGDFAYTINSEASSISVINLNTHTVCATIQVGKYPDSFTTDGQFGFVNTTDKNTIYIIDLSDNMVIETLQSSQKYVSLNCTDTHLYAGLQKFIKLKKNGMRLFKYPYPGIEGMYNQDHNEAFSNFEEAALSKNYEKAKDYFDIAIALGNKKANAVALYAFCNNLWGAKRNEFWENQFFHCMDFDYFSLLSHGETYPHAFKLKPKEKADLKN